MSSEEEMVKCFRKIDTLMEKKKLGYGRKRKMEELSKFRKIVKKEIDVKRLLHQEFLKKKEKWTIICIAYAVARRKREIVSEDTIGKVLDH